MPVAVHHHAVALQPPALCGMKRALSPSYRTHCNMHAGDFLKAFCLQLAVLTNHQNGRDTHIRQVKVFGPRRDPLQAIGFPLNFTDERFQAYATIR